EPERATRGYAAATRVGGRGRGGGGGGGGRVQHAELVCGRGGGRRGLAVAVRRARRAVAVRRRRHCADRAGICGGHGPGVLARPRPGGHRPRAPRAQGRRALRAGLDLPGWLHRSAVNVYFHTFGCKANQYDTDLVRQAFADQGAVVVADPAAADVAVVNSCTVTEESEAKLRRLVRRLARRGPRLETVVMGCAAALDDGRIAALPG